MVRYFVKFCIIILMLYMKCDHCHHRDKMSGFCLRWLGPTTTILFQPSLYFSNHHTMMDTTVVRRHSYTIRDIHILAIHHPGYMYVSRPSYMYIHRHCRSSFANAYGTIYKNCCISTCTRGAVWWVCINYSTTKPLWLYSYFL